MKNELGFWKGNRVIAIYKEDYVESDDIVVIWDDGKKVVQSGMEIGVLGNSGYITEITPKRYKPATPSYKKKKKKETSAAEEDNYYKQFSVVVDEFFASLSVGSCFVPSEETGVVLGERKQLW